MNKKNYFFGNPNRVFNQVLDALSRRTKVNSFKTSSIPLAGFWKPSNNLQKFLERFKQETQIDLSDTNKCFEFPTECLDTKGNRLQHSCPSMTDLMLINDSYRVAIEAKYTEYSESHYELISEWNKKDAEHKIAIKENWFRYIKEAGATSLSDVSELPDIPYQFLHRAASACFGNPKNPVLIYQLFYDDSNKNKMEEFVKDLETWGKELEFTDKIKFFVIKVKITNVDDVERKYSYAYSDLFTILKYQDVYEFDWNKIDILQVKK